MNQLERIKAKLPILMHMGSSAGEDLAFLVGELETMTGALESIRTSTTMGPAARLYAARVLDDFNKRLSETEGG